MENQGVSTRQEQIKGGYPINQLKIAGCIAIAVILLAVLLFMVWVRPLKRATRDYNAAVREYNAQVEIYLNLINEVAVENIDGISGQVDVLPLADENMVPVIRSLLGGNTADKTRSDIESVQEMTSVMEQTIQIVQQIKNPDAAWVISRLGAVDEINAIQVVTTDNDPNGLHGIEGGYAACIYFTCDAVGPETVPGDDPVAKGTDGGGALEIYSTLSDAEARCEYLSEFDHTILYTGSYGLIGTMVVRTSYRFTGEEQYQLTNKIVQQFTKIE